jgi:large subunit ribosomal protein L17
MKHQIAGRKFGRPTGHRMALYRNLVADLFRHGKIVTTEARAKEIRGLSEKIITMGKENTLASRRRALAFIYDKAIVDKVFAEIAPKFKERPGGYTRLLKLGSRPGDGAPTVKLELVE